MTGAFTLGLLVAACSLLRADGRQGEYSALDIRPRESGASQVSGVTRPQEKRHNDAGRTLRDSVGVVNGTAPAATAAAAAPSLDSRHRALQGSDLRPVGGRGVSDDGSVFVERKPGYSRNAANAEEFPALTDSTVMFLHVFKCAGSTLRRMLVAWAEAEEEPGAIVHQCNHTSQEGEICLMNYQLIDEQVQSEILSRQKVLAGHFLWGFQNYLQKPYLMVTALRNPLEVFVSGQQYTHKRKTRTLEEARLFISKAMNKALEQYGGGRVSANDSPSGENGQEQIGGFVFRLVGQHKNKLFGETLEAAADEAIRNLETFWLVAAVEQYAGFEEVLKRLLDPEGRHEDVWQTYSAHRFNTSPVGSHDVLATLDPDLVSRFNGSLALQWKVYEKAVALWDVRCREILPSTMHEEMCTVALPSSTYAL